MTRWQIFKLFLRQMADPYNECRPEFSLWEIVFLKYLITIVPAVCGLALWGTILWLVVALIYAAVF